MYFYTYTLVDFVYGPLVFIIIVLLVRVRKYRHVATRPEMHYFTKGLYAKLIAGVCFTLIYTLYYGGGDTVHYILDSNCMLQLFFQNPSGFFLIMQEGLDYTKWLTYFNDETGYPVYWRDAQTFYVVRIAVPFVFLGAGAFIVSTILFAASSFVGIWKLYQVFIMEFPKLYKEMAIAIFFIPSVVFWGSGIMKDTITLSCVGYYTHSFYMIFIKKKITFWLIFSLVVSSYFILMIKPYIIFALLPGSLLWFVNAKVTGIKNTVIRFISGPFLLSIAIGGGYLLLISMGNTLGSYAVENVMQKAVITNQDLKSEYYGGSSFDIGDFDATIPSMLSKAPAAINAGIFRPYLWEAHNIVMVLSGLESLFLLFLTARTLIRVRVFAIIPLIIKNHLLTFSMIFSLFFAFSVGISTSNFGSLVRYRIPVLPFYVASLFIVEHLYAQKHKGSSAEILPDKTPEPESENQIAEVNTKASIT